MNLPHDWITLPSYDFEMKKYQLMAYLEHVSQKLRERRIFPVLAELENHFKVLRTVYQSKIDFQDVIKKEVNGIDFKNKTLLYKATNLDNREIKEFEQILTFSLARIKNIYMEVQNAFFGLKEFCQLDTIGIHSLYSREGFILIDDLESIHVYQFKVIPFHKSLNRYDLNINYDYIKTYDKNFQNTYENIKMELFEELNIDFNPSTYAVTTTQKLPLNNTLVPISKHLLLKTTNKISA